MSATRSAMFVGLILGLAAVIGGLPGFLITLVHGDVGFVVGRILDGEIDPGSFTGRRRDR